mgnify:CR=1 FL=1
MAKTRSGGAGRRLTASGAPKQGTVAVRKLPEQREAHKRAKAKEALKNPRTHKQRRVAKQHREAAARAAFDAKYNSLSEKMDAAMEKARNFKVDPQQEDDKTLKTIRRSHGRHHQPPTGAAGAVS